MNNLISPAFKSKDRYGYKLRITGKCGVALPQALFLLTSSF